MLSSGRGGSWLVFRLVVWMGVAGKYCLNSAQAVAAYGYAACSDGSGGGRRPDLHVGKAFSPCGVLPHCPFCPRWLRSRRSPGGDFCREGASGCADQLSRDGVRCALPA